VRQAQVDVAELGRRDVLDGVTVPEVTLAACLRTCSFDEALAIADSALRDGFGARNLAHIADLARGPGSAQMRRVARHADGRAANPFESGLRAICLSVPGLDVEPQVTIRDGDVTARPDLVDRRLLMAFEADSFEWHGGREALASDARRYNRLVIAGWMVLRFSWEDVMFHADEVREVLVAAVALAEAMSQRRPRPPSAA
jgi:very-short-patch-repair endonuclease